MFKLIAYLCWMSDVACRCRLARLECTCLIFKSTVTEYFVCILAKLVVLFNIYCILLTKLCSWLCCVGAPWPVTLWTPQMIWTLGSVWVLFQPRVPACYHSCSVFLSFCRHPLLFLCIYLWIFHEPITVFEISKTVFKDIQPSKLFRQFRGLKAGPFFSFLLLLSLDKKPQNYVQVGCQLKEKYTDLLKMTGA